MIEKGIIIGICHAIHRYLKANNKYMKNYDRNKESSYSKYWGLNNVNERALSEKLPVNGLKWVEDTSQFDTFTIHRTAGEREGISLTPMYHFQPLHRHLEISWVITAESSLLQVVSSRV